MTFNLCEEGPPCCMICWHIKSFQSCCKNCGNRDTTRIPQHIPYVCFHMYCSSEISDQTGHTYLQTQHFKTLQIINNVLKCLHWKKSYKVLGNKQYSDGFITKTQFFAGIFGLQHLGSGDVDNSQWRHQQMTICRCEDHKNRSAQITVSSIIIYCPYASYYIKFSLSVYITTVIVHCLA